MIIYIYIIIHMWGCDQDHWQAERPKGEPVLGSPGVSSSGKTRCGR